MNPNYLWTAWMTIGALGCSAETDDTGFSGPTIEVSGRVNDAVFGNDVPGASVCNRWEECVSTDGNGHFAHPLVPAEERTFLRVDSQGAAGSLAAFETTSDPQEIPVLGLAEASYVDGYYFLIDTERVPGTGIVAFSVSNGIDGDGVNVSGIRVRLDPPADGPHYGNEIGLPDTERFETGTNGGGLIINVPPGEVELEHIGLPDGCQTRLGWGGPELLTLPVEADRVTYARIECADATP